MRSGGVVLGHLLRAMKQPLRPKPRIVGQRVAAPLHEVACDVLLCRLSVEQKLHLVLCGPKG